MAEIDPDEFGTLNISGVINRLGEFWRNVPSYDRTAEVLLHGEEAVISGEDLTW